MPYRHKFEGNEMFCRILHIFSRQNHEKGIKTEYSSDSRLGSDPERLFPFELMQDHFRKFARYGLIMASVLLPVITQDRGSGFDSEDMAEKVIEMKDLDMDSIYSGSSRKKFYHRLRDVVVDMARLGYI